ncbi:MAG: ABC-F family ATP-binding cassette domain-containing protein [Synergistales bacterium]|nr:ABC-F family ATP-binding cassette domain-containing protein [Synergistales bacterium]
MIKLEGINLSFGETQLFRNLTWHIPDGAKIGLVGRNGAGKTTLFRLMLGQETPDSGTVTTPGKARLGFLPQETVALGEGTVLSYLKAYTGMAQLEAELARLEERITGLSARKQHDNDRELQSLLHRHDQVLHRFHLLGGYGFEAEMSRTLAGLGFPPGAASRACSEFSGGWKMRIFLSALLLSRPDILLLDEPTNHLDTESMEWLEQYLQAHSGTIIAISHDHRFLDRIMGGIAELVSQRIMVYQGNYSQFLQKRNQYIEQIRREQAQLQERKQQLERFIGRFRYTASHASQVQSKIKQLEKLEAQEQTLPEEPQRVRFAFPECPRSGLQVVTARDVRKQYGENTVFDGVSLEVQRGERVALVGANGAGKSTLCRMLSMQEPPTLGDVAYGYNVHLGFFSQESQHNLDYSRTVWEEITNTGSEINACRKRDLLGGFLFRDDDIHKPVQLLSGGEKSRLALLKLLLQPLNLLILDEPTNHLDMTTKDLFQDALLSFGGTVIIVSHDRYFLDQLITRVLEVRGGGLHEYLGNYSYFIEKRAEQRERQGDTASQSSDTATKTPTPEQPRSRKEARRKESEERKQKGRERREVTDQLEPLEEQIEELEREKSEVEERLCDPQTLQNAQEVQSLMRRLNDINGTLDTLFPQWERLMEQLHAAEEATG